MKPTKFPPQSQPEQPGVEAVMNPQPEVVRKHYKGSEKLKHKIALISGGDSGIGRSVAVHFALEGASVAIMYLNEEDDAEETRDMVTHAGGDCLLIRGDITEQDFCVSAVEKTIAHFGRLDILVNNAGVQYPENDLTAISEAQLLLTYETNIFSMFYLTQAALKHMQRGGRIINTTSITGYRGSEHLIDYASTKGAITSFTRSLAVNLAGKGILVNAVAPGPIWTPLIPSSFDDVSDFGSDTPLGRAGQPSEVAPAYVYLASEDSSYVTGQVIHVNGGGYVGG